ncbi:MAG: transcriptional regulator [Methylocystis sp.]|nr:MAG: transcriptional regulator [Methylocystis sp.]
MTTLPTSPDDLLFRHAAGALDPGFSLLVETHLEMSPAARDIHAQFEALGGMLLDELEPAQVDPSALNRALREIDAGDAPRGGERVAPSHPAMPEGFVLPESLARRAIGPWRWIGPGVRSASIRLPPASTSRAFLLEIAPGVRVPRHGHEGDETTCVLRGSFRDGEARYVEGEVAQADAGVEHDILVDSDMPCLCLIAMEGRTRPSGWFGRLYQKFRDI